MYQILLVDDEYYYREALKNTISWEAYGCTICTEANNGVAGLEKARELKPDIVLADVSMPFMNGLEMIAEIQKELVDALLDKILAFYLECNRRMFEKAGDLMQIFFMGDDYGTQACLLYGPELFRRFIKPRLKKLYDLAKSYGYVVQQHSCGSIVKIIPDLIENGLDGLHPIQVSAAGMALAGLKETFGKQLYFAGSIDAMHLLTDGTAEQIETAIRETMALFDHGGFIFGPSQGFLPEIPVERIVLMYELGYRYGCKEITPC